jgi:acetyl-CoA carboxylase biotin carboxyl carrier protein
MSMDLRKLKTLVDLVSESNISELEITETDGKVRIVKAVPGVVAAPMVMAAPLAAAMPAAQARGAGTDAVPAADEAVVDEGHIVKSPMVGTFYRAATPGGKPLVEIGSSIKQGEALCIIEAMKIMNEIDADEGGKVTKILVENGQAVEFGQALFVIDRRG